MVRSTSNEKDKYIFSEYWESCALLRVLLFNREKYLWEETKPKQVLTLTSWLEQFCMWNKKKTFSTASLLMIKNFLSLHKYRSLPNLKWKNHVTQIADIQSRSYQGKTWFISFRLIQNSKVFVFSQRQVESPNKKDIAEERS